jgi:phosphomethylpyrimidine synthase
LSDTWKNFSKKPGTKKITQEVRDYAASQKLSEAEALQKGMEAKAVEFVKQGAEIYKKAWP